MISRYFCDDKSRPLKDTKQTKQYLDFAASYMFFRHMGERASIAAHYARTELFASQNSIEFHWQEEFEAWDGCEPLEKGTDLLMVAVMVKNINGNMQSAGSLGMIALGGTSRERQNYMRYIEAEVACAAMDEIRKILLEARMNEYKQVPNNDMQAGW